MTLSFPSSLKEYAEHCYDYDCQHDSERRPDHTMIQYRSRPQERKITDTFMETRAYTQEIRV
jgi:hypothetical protein